ncbi:zinc finger protein 474-like [Bolinopsis microptera]|uniref:zinc finger protein 474-like n=1 Tax=Bolinopsis microptera TaxID=2820187 RepID=UPI00307ACD33
MGLRQVGVVCYICGREFGTRSIGIHEPQCLKKWDIQNQKLPKSKRQAKPVKPVEFDEPFSADPTARAAQIEKINMASNIAATENLVPCRNCSRKFLPTRIESHEKVCCNLKMAPAAALKSNSGYYGQRVHVVDGQQVDAIAMKKEKTFSSNTIEKKKTGQFNTNIPTKPVNNNATNVLQSRSHTTANLDLSRGPLQTVPCQFCGKAISHNAINIHIKKCRSRSEPLPQTSDSSECTYCNKKYPLNVIAVHIRNCSAAPKKIFGPKGPSEKVSPKKQKPQLTPPQTPPKRIEPLSGNVNNVKGNANNVKGNPYARYSPRPPSADRLSSSLDTSLEVEVDLILGVDPGLVMNCMVCGLIVLKSKLNTHYHNYCQKTTMTRSITIPPSTTTKVPKPPYAPKQELVACDICNRSFRADVIEEHEMRCAIKNQDELNKSITVPDISRAPNNDAEGGNSFTTNGLSSPTQVIGKFVTGKFVPCINCNKSFTVRSLVIHQKQCMK